MSTITVVVHVAIRLSLYEAHQLRAVLGCVATGPLDDLYEALEAQLPEAEVEAEFEQDEDSDWKITLKDVVR